MIEAIVFDVDGTLIDTVDLHAEAWQEAFRRYGKEADFAHIRAQIGKGGDQILPVFFSSEELARISTEITNFRQAIFKAKYLQRVRPFPMVRELFHRIKVDGKRIALASSAKQDELEGYERMTNIADLVDEATTSSDVERSKPHPDIFDAVLKKLQLEPHQAVAVGDTPYDAQAAGTAGIKTIGVLCGGFPEDDLRAAGCVAVYKDPADLLQNYEQSLLGG
jgi:HAD superfamily hydrolase (TIGR01509 family)